jgi:FMN reductase
MISVVPHVVVLGGSPAPGSRTEQLGDRVVALCRRRSATAEHLTGPELELPFYRPGTDAGGRAARLLREVSAAHGVVLVSPAYNGGVSGLLKNALDHLTDLAGDDRPFLDGRAVGCVAIAGGAQGANAVLAGMRTAVHALRGWPTPLGVMIHPSEGVVPEDPMASPANRRQLELMVDQVLGFARVQAEMLADPLAVAPAEIA